MKSKVIQISVVSSESENCNYIYALCEDGSIWVKATVMGSTWEPLYVPKKKEVNNASQS